MATSGIASSRRRRRRRYLTFVTNDEITKDDAGEEPARRRSGAATAATRTGRITVAAHRGGGHKRHAPAGRLPAREARDPGARWRRSSTIRTGRARIALLFYRDGEKRYIIAPHGLKVGRHRRCRGRRPTSCPATRCRIRNIPLGTLVHNVELQPGKGGQLCRSAGTQAQLLAKEGEHAHAQAALRRDAAGARSTCMATDRAGRQPRPRERVGRQGGAQCAGRASGRPCAARSMNPVDHPMGGGEGKGKGNHPDDAVGQADQGLQDAARRAAVGPLHRHAPDASRSARHGTLAQEGPVHRRAAASSGSRS